jgi:hypothetical protein
MEAERVGQKQRGEVALFEEFCEICPVRQVSPFRCGPVVWMSPLPEGQVADGEHVEAVKDYAFLAR